MKKSILISFFLIYSMSIYAQFDKKSTPLRLELKSKTTTDIPDNFSNDLPSIDFKSSIDNKNDNYLKKYFILNKKQPTKSILEPKNDFKNPGDEIKDKLNKKIADKPIDDSFRSDQFLGQFDVKSKYLKIVCRDHEYPDGDRVRILVNDKVVIPEILLESASKEYYIDLSKGFNKVEFEALNQGTSGPNTAAFRVYDDKGNIVTSNEWNLTTGVKAKIIVLKKDEDTETKESE
ncbi:hypothetical protein [Flavobacterium sp.]|uniref:hypothetical protein n=1 Tax=Flavobacterium sp. TaxID=239 RepID=UPI003D2E528E